MQTLFPVSLGFTKDVAPISSLEITFWKEQFPIKNKIKCTFYFSNGALVVLQREPRGAPTAQTGPAAGWCWGISPHRYVPSAYLYLFYTYWWENNHRKLLTGKKAVKLHEQSCFSCFVRSTAQLCGPCACSTAPWSHSTSTWLRGTLWCATAPRTRPPRPRSPCTCELQ